MRKRPCLYRLSTGALQSDTFLQEICMPSKLMTRKQIREFFTILSETIVPESELKWRTPLDLLIAVVLSAQATDKSVNLATKKLWLNHRIAEDYLHLGEDGLRDYIKTIGLYRNKAKHIIGLCRILADDFGGSVPDTREALMKLPGVGRKTANVVLNVVFKKPTLAVDTHVFRVANRVGLVKAKTPDAVESALVKKIPKEHSLHAHHYLILHGRYTCKARRPGCPDCPVQHCCNYPDKTKE